LKPGASPNQDVPPYYDFDSGSATGSFSRVEIGLNDFLMTWVCISRPWVLDVDGNEQITENERSPRYVFAHDTGPRSANQSNGQSGAGGPGGLSGQALTQYLAGAGAQGNEPVLIQPGQPPMAFWGEVFKVSDLRTQADSLISESGQSPLRQTVRGKPVNFTLVTYLDNDGNRLYPRFGGVGSEAKIVCGDTGAGVPARNLSFYRHPLRLTQRDGPFEQIAEVFDVPVWGPVLKQEGSDWKVKGTFGEMLVGRAVVDALPPGTTQPAGATEPKFPTFGPVNSDGNLVQGADSLFDTTRFQFQRGRAPISSVFSFVPRLPAGASILDGFTLDRAGFVRKDLDNDGLSGEEPEMMAFEQRRLRLARGFAGALTPGLINVNTAPLEVLRALPNMQYLSYNRAAIGAGAPVPPSRVKVNFPETIINYRDRYPALSGFLPGPKYDDRGFVPEAPATYPFPFHPGMRGERGFVSVGELAVLDREFRPSNLPNDPEAVAPDPNLIWFEDKSWSVNFAGRDPYRVGEDPTIVQPPTGGHTPDPEDPPQTHVGAGWRAPLSGAPSVIQPPIGPVGGRYSAQLATERLATTVLAADNTTTPTFDPVIALAQVAGDQVERNALLKGIANIATTRSDVFTVYLKVRSVAQNQQTGKWDATDPNTLIDESRYLMVVDRSNVNRPTDEPRILMFERIVD